MQDRNVLDDAGAIEPAQIYRYEVPVDGSVHHLSVADPIGVGCRNLRVVEFWALNKTFVTPRGFIVVGTGHPLPDNWTKIWGTAVEPGGALVWHLVEVVL